MRAPADGGASHALGTIPFRAIARFDISPDGTRLIYARCDLCAAALMMAENFR